MKKMIFTLAITTFIASTVLVGCQGSTKKEEAAKDKIEEARDELDDAKEELSEARVAATEAEWKAFKESTNATIAQNEIRITELKAKMDAAIQAMKADGSLNTLIEKYFGAEGLKF